MTCRDDVGTTNPDKSESKRYLLVPNCFLGQDPTAMSPDHWSKLTWDTVSAGGYDLFDPIGYLDRKRDRAYKQRVIVTPATYNL